MTFLKNFLCGLALAVLVANPVQALIWGAETYVDPVTGNFVTLLLDTHLDYHDLKQTERQRYDIQRILERYCDALVVEDSRAQGVDEKMPSVPEILQGQRERFKKIKDILNLPDIKFRTSDEHAWQESVLIGPMGRLYDYCQSIKFPCINSECRQEITYSLTGEIPTPGDQVWKNLRTRSEKIIDFSVDPNENNEEIKSYYVASMQQFAEESAWLVAKIARLSVSVQGHIDSEMLTEFNPLVEGYSIWGIRQFKNCNHTLVCQGARHCITQSKVLLQAGYKKIFSQVDPYADQQFPLKIARWQTRPMNICGYFEALYKECKIEPKREMDVGAAAAAH